MTVRSDVTVDFSLSPRIITVPLTGGITIQDLHDTIKTIEALPWNMDDVFLLSTTGKENLGGSVFVGLTSQLNDAQIEPVPNATPTSSGTATSADATGTILIDTGATFQTDGITRGYLVINFTDRSMASVLSVDSENQLTTRVLQGGVENDWDISDAYSVYEIVQFDIDGGNVVAVDDVGGEISAVFPSAMTQIIRTSSSSATLQELSAIQFASFNGGVTIDVVDGTAGTTFPIGTLETPVDNVVDAVTIANTRGFNKFFIIGNITLDTGDNVDDFVFVGESISKTTITINPGASTLRTEFIDAFITGTLDGNSGITKCNIGTLVFVNGEIRECGFAGTITLGGGIQADIINCHDDTAGLGIPIIDMGGSGQSLIVRNYNGGLQINNKTGADDVSIDVDPGRVVLDSTVTNGEIVVRGVGTLTDNSVGATVIDDVLKSSDIKIIKKILQNKFITDPVAGTLTVYDDDDTTILLQADLWEDIAASQAYRGQGAERRDRMT